MRNPNKVTSIIPKALLSILIILSLFLFLSSCSYSAMGSSSSEGGLSGKQGVVLQYVPNNPPSTIYYGDDSMYEIGIEGFNRGIQKTDIEAHMVGFDSSLVEVSPVEFAIAFDDDEKKTRWNPEGGYGIPDGDITLKPTNELEKVDTYNFDLKTVYCYTYYTEAYIPICIDPSPNKHTKEDGCTPGTVSTNGQGAPVSIDSVDVEPMPGKARLKINIKQHGSGTVYESSHTTCAGEIKRQFQDIVTVASGKITVGGVECKRVSEKDTVKLRGGSGTIICTADFTDKEASAYKTILHLQLEYKIKDVISKNINIINENT